jgi:hypothetical protein
MIKINASPFSVLLAPLAAVAGAALAAPPATTVTIMLKGHSFSPSSVQVPAGQALRVVIVNGDATAEEIDGDALGWDKPIPPHGKVVLNVQPLKSGSYSFSGELHPKTAQGTLVAVASAAH